MRRYGWVIRLRPDRRETYLRLHAAVWPDVERRLREANIRNYSIFLHRDLLFGYYEYVGEDHDADQRRIAEDPQTRAWWKLTDPCQESLAEPGSGHWWAPMDEVWHLTEEAS
ncbi:L-rhamnose mutarotase [Micromonospora carbonacea]|uniref:L-rhamnose mutarotase n=1 Tax=Micromonospora carbonacea TaxID=47853 RepID=A0A7H8XMH9_9ACTN|nr:MULTISPECIES: L-rhamnose mutarotase [Micromonospora]MBB5827416.1 L-rhamnose mutarotase [Micromonospora carbonacea]MDG4818665.1 L-rhamnose mutarotase [Micromonospora sp. WMMD956]QLD24821.1 L-rhamnose mutarotase [Micromonospora carbonacea]